MLTLGGLALGLLLGMRHALEPDHLAGLSTVVTRSRSGRESVLLGALWGVGHTSALLVFGGLLVLTGSLLSTGASAALELLVATMLVVLGARALRRAPQPEPAAGPQLQAASRVRTLSIGLVHGLAGTGALTALVLAQLPTARLQILYMALFGVGSIGGMAAVSGFVGASLSAGALRKHRHLVEVTAGVVSVGCGLAWTIGPLRELGWLA
jgi:hypothetical protein